MKQFNSRRAFQQIRTESQRQKQAFEEWAKRERQKWAAYSKRRGAFHQLMQLFSREAAGALDIPMAAALMVEFGQTIPAEWVKARVRFVRNRLAELPECSARDASFKEIALNLLLLANAGDHAQVAEVLTEAMRCDPDEVESFRLCLSNWLVDKVVDGWPPLPDELKPLTEASADVGEVAPGILTAVEEWLPASKAVERAEQCGHPILLKWLTRDAHKHGAWMSGASRRRHMIWLTRARDTWPRRASSAWFLTAPDRISPSNRSARAMSRATRGTRPGRTVPATAAAHAAKPLGAPPPVRWKGMSHSIVHVPVMMLPPWLRGPECRGGGR